MDNSNDNKNIEDLLGESDPIDEVPSASQPQGSPSLTTGVPAASISAQTPPAEARPTSPSQQSTPPIAQKPPISQPPSAPIATPPQQKMPQKPAKKGGALKVLLVVILGVVILGGGAFAAYYFGLIPSFFTSVPEMSDVNNELNGDAMDTEEDAMIEDDSVMEKEDDAMENEEDVMTEEENEQIIRDSDNDGLTDAEEITYGTNPNIADTDADGYSDGDEVANGYNPLGAGKLGAGTGIQTPPPAVIEDVAPVVAVCGNNTIESGEQCDRGSLNGQDIEPIGSSCTELGFVGGTLRCGTDCQYDLSQCFSVGF